MVSRLGPTGFTLLELLVATSVTLLALSLAVALVQPPLVAFRTLPEAMDAQQRLRVAVQTLAAGISAAGAGPSLGWGAGSAPAWPGVLPCDATNGPLGSLPDGCARHDAITVIAMGVAAPQVIVAEPLAAPDAPIRVTALSACSLTQPPCRLHIGARALIADRSGAWDVLEITSVSADGTLIEHAADTLSRPYGREAIVGEVETNAFSLRVDPTSKVTQLRRATNGSSAFPLIDHLTELSFEYFGEPAGPQVMDDEEADRRRTTYGPSPPPVGIDNPLDEWAPGENCTFSRHEGQPVSRLISLPAGESGLARLPLSALADGPWCPDPASPNRFDGDLLRIRMVRMTLRVQAQASSARGIDRSWFSQPGSAREAGRLVPDLEVQVDVGLRNTHR